jgi:succinate dehydrogenase / fumarate reductase cytochrome b subunit
MSEQAPSIGGAIGSGDQPRLRWLREVWGSTIGKKFVVATTGAILAAYVVLHALGNLKALQGLGGGTPAIDGYAGWLRTVGEPAIPHQGVLWFIRLVLLLALVLHVSGVLALWKRNREARPAGNRDAPVIERTPAARTMLVGGLLLLAFIVFHILQFTTRTIHPTPLGSATVYTNLYLAFQEWWLVAVYVGAVVLLGFHLYHGVWSATQTMGWDTPNRNPTLRRAAAVISIGVTLAFASIPILFFVDALPAPS